MIVLRRVSLLICLFCASVSLLTTYIQARTQPARWVSPAAWQLSQSAEPKTKPSTNTPQPTLHTQLSLLEKSDATPVSRCSGALREVTLCTGETISGSLTLVDSREWKLLTLSGQELTLPFGAIHEISQPAGWQQLQTPTFLDDWESTVESTDALLPKSKIDVRYELPISISAGRFALRFQTPQTNRVWGVDLEFERAGATFRERIFLGSQLPIYSMKSDSELHSTRTQRLKRTAGLHQLTCLWDETSATWMIDEFLLNSRSKSCGNLIAVSLFAASETKPTAIEIHDVSLHRKRTNPVKISIHDGLEDLVVHTQAGTLFGEVIACNDRLLTLKTNARSLHLRWNEIEGIRLKQTEFVGQPVAGILAETSLAAPVDFPGVHADRLQCAIQGIDKEVLILQHPFLGEWRLPLPFVESVQVRSFGHLQHLEPMWKHLGNEVQTGFAIPRPEGSQLLIKFPHQPNPDNMPRRYQLRMLVHDLEPAGLKTPPGSKHLQELRAGFLLTHLYLNGVRLACLNRQIQYRQARENPEEILIMVPGSLLKPGENRLRILQTSAAENLSEFDDCEIGRLLLESFELPD